MKYVQVDPRRLKATAGKVGPRFYVTRDNEAKNWKLWAVRNEDDELIATFERGQGAWAEAVVEWMNSRELTPAS